MANVGKQVGRFLRVALSSGPPLRARRSAAFSRPPALSSGPPLRAKRSAAFLTPSCPFFRPSLEGGRVSTASREGEAAVRGDASIPLHRSFLALPSPFKGGSDCREDASGSARRVRVSPFPRHRRCAPQRLVSGIGPFFRPSLEGGRVSAASREGEGVDQCHAPISRTRAAPDRLERQARQGRFPIVQIQISDRDSGAR